MIYANRTSKCPHCNIHVRFEPVDANNGRTGTIRGIYEISITTNKGIGLNIATAGCPSCGELILTVKDNAINWRPDNVGDLNIPLWPDSTYRPIPEEVTKESPSIAEDFRQAVAVLPKSKKASAALARRCLQSILREKGGTTSKNLADQIDEVINSLPTEIGNNVDAIRQVGNFSAHPMKSTNSGEIVDVAEGEAEWLLLILEDLFDHYYVAPAKALKRRTSLNQTLQDLGKSTLKQPQC